MAEKKTIEVFGTLEWAKLFEQNRDMGPYDQETNGATSVTIIVDKDEQKKLKESGSQKKPVMKKLEEEGVIAYNFKRPWEDKYGRDWAGGAPKVFGPDGSAWDLEVDGLIGNGSKGVVVLDVYETAKGVGTRLVAVQVIEHVPYVNPDGSEFKPAGYQPRDFTKEAAPTTKETPSEPKAKKETKKAPETAPF